MSAELTALALAGLLVMAQLAWLAVRANLEVGPAYFLSPRDDPPPAMPGRDTLRLKRAYENHLEALLPFAAAAVTVTLAEAASALTAACAWAYLAARLAYVPAYRFGWVPWRSALYGAGYLATGVMFLAALLGG